MKRTYTKTTKTTYPAVMFSTTAAFKKKIQKAAKKKDISVASFVRKATLEYLKA
jgi:hypothetical protein